jgi:tRNA dimethylallyltransferase
MTMTQNWKEKVTFHVGNSEHPLIVVLGPTASGKTAFGITLEKFLASSGTHVEIVNVDSRQLYRFMDIGTAKITTIEMQGIPHHLLDVLDPKEEATAAWYKREATRVINEIHRRGNVPILVGGSMLYISALIDGLEFVSGADPTLRKVLEERYDVDAGVSLYKELQDADLESAAAFSKNNKTYVIRAMEIFEVKGVKPSDAKQKGVCPWDLLIFGIQQPREKLVERINARTHQMFTSGWIEEVQSLLDLGYCADDPGMKSHGYREIAEAISREKRKEKREKIDEEILIDLIAAKTRQYAKRQMTWWKNDQRIQWIEAP